ncbi:MAG: sulfatase-like hydrolase/transferase, partial [Kordiimonas sp.]
YISDAALGEKLDELIEQHHRDSDKPLFIFAITIESHGPWAPGRLARHLDEKNLVKSNPVGDHEFALYQRHMENLLKLCKRLTVDNKQTIRPRTVAMYGDHMPALGPLFDKYGFDEPRVDYLVWNSETKPTPPNNMCIENFGKYVLQEAGVELQETNAPS